MQAHFNRTHCSGLLRFVPVTKNLSKNEFNGAETYFLSAEIHKDPSGLSICTILEVLSQN